MALNPKRQRLNRYDTLEFIHDTASDEEVEGGGGGGGGGEVFKHLVTPHQRV
jgi:hypothetical protein